MKKITSLVFVTLFLSFSVRAQGADSAPKLDALAFLSGCWEINVPDRKLLVSEQWMSPFGNAMVGMARNVRDGKMGSYEYLRIVQNDTGIHYIAKPSQSPSETSFKMVELRPNEVIFENPGHDFPQRVIYKLANNDNLAARIEGTMNGQKRGMDFPYKRVKCP